MKKDMNFFKRFKFTKAGLAFSIVVILISIAAFFFCSVEIKERETNINTNENDSSNFSKENNNPFYLSLLETGKDFSVVLFSTFGVNLLLGLCIEKKSQNKAFEEFFLDDVIKTPQFYEKLPDEEKEKMLEGLELNHYYNNNSVLREMCNTIREKMIESVDEYYCTKCHYSVNVTVKDNFFEKDITLNKSILSYENKKTLNRFRITGVTNQKISGLSVCEITSVSLNGKDITNKCREEDEQLNKEKIGSKNLDKATGVYYKEKLHLSNTKSQDFVIHYTTRCPIDDLTSSFRTSVPCKEFSVNYSMDNSQKYKLVTYTFGCCEHAKDFSNLKHPNTANVEFKNPIFKDDGIVVVMCPNE